LILLSLILGNLNSWSIMSEAFTLLKAVPILRKLGHRIPVWSLWTETYLEVRASTTCVFLLWTSRLWFAVWPRKSHALFHRTWPICLFISCCLLSSSYLFLLQILVSICCNGFRNQMRHCLVHWLADCKILHWSASTSIGLIF